MALPPVPLGMVTSILLATDGTLTHILEAYAAEPVHLVKLSQDFVTDAAVRDGLGLVGDERALRRVILLRGTKTDATFVYAESVVMLDRLPASVAAGLLDSDTPIGKLLYSCRAETHREITATGAGHDRAVAGHLGLPGDEPLAWRTYQIVFEGRPVARILEKFPRALGGGSDDLPDSSDLDTVPRILLATDGAITHILQAYAGEPIDLVPLASSPDGEPEPELPSGGERPWRRRSLLRGRASGRVFVHGSAMVLLDCLPPVVADELQATGTGVLRLLAKHGVETFRETIAEWQGWDEQLAAHLGVEPSEVLVARIFLVVVGGRPVAWITETFPKAGLSSPAAAGSAEGGPGRGAT